MLTSVRTVRQVRPDMTASDALTAVNMVRRISPEFVGIKR